MLLAFLLLVFLIHQSAGFDDYIVDAAHVSDGKLHLSLLSTDSSACITGYRYRVRENDVELKVFAGGPLFHTSEEYSARLDAVISLPEKLQNQYV